MSQNQRDEDEVGNSKIENYSPNTRAMKAWKKRIYVDDEPEMEKEEEETPTQEIFPANKKHTTFCLILITMSIGGAIFSMIGYSIGPQTCDNDTIFSRVGVLAFFASMVIGIPVNLIIWLFSLTNPEFDSRKVFSLIIIHAGITLICIVAFNEFLLQYLWCGPGGPHYDIGAGF